MSTPTRGVGYSPQRRTQHNIDLLKSAGEAILKGIEAKTEEQLAPSTLYTDIIEAISD